jgi:hypothetical protein
MHDNADYLRISTSPRIDHEAARPQTYYLSVLANGAVDKAHPMKTPLRVAIAAAMLIAATSGANACSPPDRSLRAFLTRFKSDAAFQRQRVVDPLPVTSSEPDAGGIMREEHTTLDAAHVRARPGGIIRGPSDAAKLRGGEGRLCERGPVVHRDHATLIQYSCDTDVYGDTYEFVRVRGCWYLERLSTSGA